MEDVRDAGLVAINPVDIQSEFIRVAADLARWNEKFADATRVFRLAEYRLDTIEAHVYLHVRQIAEADGDRISEGTIRARINIDGRVKEGKETLIEAEAELLSIKGTVQALITKRDMLISLGAHLREEMKGDPSIRSNQRDDNYDWNKRNE